MELRAVAKEGGTLPPPPSENDAGIEWGGPLEVRLMNGFHELTADEALFCAENHVPPVLFAKCRRELMEKSQNTIVTIYDVRVLSTLDLIRSQALYEFLVEKRSIPAPHI